jgi:hypothetical protein
MRQFIKEKRAELIKEQEKGREEAQEGPPNMLVQETSVMEGEGLDGKFNTESIESENILAMLKMGQ